MQKDFSKWQKLLELTHRFNDQASWNWMMGDDIFGVQNPETGEIGYCVVMGCQEEVFGLAVYLGSEGLEFIKQLMADYEFGPDFLYKQKCLTITFEDREDLDSEDYHLIKDAGVKFRGRKQWPQFRSYLPGYFPWFINAGEAEFLIHALDQAIWVAEQVDANPDFLVPDNDDQYYVRIPAKSENGLVWSGEWLTPEPIEAGHAKVQIIVDELRLRKLKRTVRQTEWTWEVDYFYSPLPVQEEKGTRPYLPLLFLCIDSDLAQIIHYQMVSTEDFSAFAEELIACVEAHEILPGAIHVSNPDLYQAFQPVAKNLGCAMFLVDQLEALEEAKVEMFSYMNEH